MNEVLRVPIPFSFVLHEASWYRLILEVIPAGESQHHLTSGIRKGFGRGAAEGGLDWDGDGDLLDFDST